MVGEVCQILMVSETRTTTYNSKSDGMVQKYNKTLTEIVAMLIDPSGRQRDLDEVLPYTSIAYRFHRGIP